MSFIVILYLLVVLALFFTGNIYFQKNVNKSGLFFLLFCIFTGLWFSMYFLSYFSTDNIDMMLVYSRGTYGLSILAIYSFLFFIIYFGKCKRKLLDEKTLSIFGGYALILILYNFSPLMIEGMYFDEVKSHYYETPGVLIGLHNILSFIFLPLLILFSYLQLKKISFLSKVRLKYILLGWFLFILLAFIFLLILPEFGIRIFEKELVIFIIPFLLSLWYSINRYHFLDIKIGIGKIFVFSLSIFWSIIIVHIIKYYFLFLGMRFINFWGISQNFGIIDLVLGIMIFLLTHNILAKLLLGNTKTKKIQSQIDILKKKIPYITKLSELNLLLYTETIKIFKIKSVKIRIFTKIDTKNSELFRYFQNDITRDFFMNDIVFLEENKHKFHVEKIKQEINKNAYLIFPLHDNIGNTIGTFSIGTKPFKDHYYTEEIELLLDFVKFLEGHLKYIEIYKEINNLNINLDKKVDEKTMKYNTLLSKQKEFIDIFSHEIKNPIAAAVFQGDALMYNMEGKNIDKFHIKKELLRLNDQLLKIGDLSNKLFSIQYFDTENVQIYKEYIDMNQFLELEFDVYSSMNKKIDFISHINKDLGKGCIDRVHFKQVIDNLVSNAIKFCGKKHGIIQISAYITGNDINIEIEDNGKGLKNIEIETIFEKYKTGPSTSIGLGMGLYLCKRIVELHRGDIRASNSKEFGGAKFIINIPK